MNSGEMCKKDGIRFPGFRGTWYRFDSETIGGVTFEAYESEVWGDEVSDIIATEDGHVVHPDAWNGLADLHEAIDGGDVKVENGKVWVDPELWALWGMNEADRPKGDKEMTDKLKKELEEHLRVQGEIVMREHLCRLTDNDYARAIGDLILDEVLEDVRVSSSFEANGMWGNDDVDLAIGRVLCKKLGLEV